MTEKEIMQYRQLGLLIERKHKEIEKKLEELDDVPVVSGKVTASQAVHPYVIIHPTVQISEPKESDKIHKDINRLEHEIADAEHKRSEIVDYILQIEDPELKNIFEMRVYEGMKWQDIAAEMNEDKLRSAYSRKFKRYLENH